MDFIYQGKYKCLSASLLKVIAVITVLVDHVGAGIILLMIKEGIYPFGLDFEASKQLYYILRHIGRQAFPIYCFLLVEGLLHTGNIKRYMLGLGLFGIVSELPFDLAVRAEIEASTLNVPHVLSVNAARVLGACNVYFTLLIGLIVIYLMKMVEEKLFVEDDLALLGHTVSNPLCVLPYFAPAAIGASLAFFIHSDYKAWGICLITIFFVFRKRPALASFAGYIMFMNMYAEVWSLPAFILILMYNGERGYLSGRFKYAFYAFYPLHFLAIYLIRCAIM